MKGICDDHIVDRGPHRETPTLLDTHPYGTYDQILMSRGNIDSSLGAVAQLGERGVRNAEVGSSSLLRSTFCEKGRIRLKKGRRHLVLGEHDAMCAVQKGTETLAQ